MNHDPEMGRAAGLPSGLALAAWAALAGCAVPMRYEPVRIPQSRWGGQYVFSYQLPENRAAGSVDATIAVVNPSYREEESALLQPVFAKVGKGFSNSMGVDLDKILIAKGMTVKGPFPSMDEITYSDKKGSALTLAPKVFVTMQIRYFEEQDSPYPARRAIKEPMRDAPGPVLAQATRRAPGESLGGMLGAAAQSQGGAPSDVIERRFEMTVGGWIAFVMQEPLSAEKMWIKRLELEEVRTRGVEVYEVGPYGQVSPEALYDGKPEAMADALEQMYPTILGKFWTFIDAEEILALKAKTSEIRKLKVY